MNQLFEKINPVLEWIMKLAITNLVWVVFNLPVAYLTLSLFFIREEPQFIMTMATLAIFAPFISFPATTAMFGVVRKWIMKEDVPLFRHYWAAYKENYKRSMAGGLVFTLAGVILTADYYYLKSTLPLAGYLFLFLLVWLFLIMLYFFADTVHTETKLFQSMKNSLILTIANPFFSFGIALISIIILYFSFTSATFLLPFFSGSSIAALSFFGYYKVFSKVVELQNSQTDQ